MLNNIKKAIYAQSNNLRKLADSLNLLADKLEEMKQNQKVIDVEYEEEEKKGSKGLFKSLMQYFK